MKLNPMMINKFNTLLQLGTQDSHPDERSFIRQANLNGLIYFFLDLVLAIVAYFVLPDATITMGLVLSAFAFLVTSIGFNYLGWTHLSRLSTVAIGVSVIVFISFYLGSESFAAASLLLSAIFPFLYFSTKEIKSIGFLLALPITAYIVLIITDYSLGPRIGPMSSTTLTWIRFVAFIFPFIGIVINAYIAVSERERKTANLKESQNLLETIFFALSHDLASPLQTISIISQLGDQAGGLSPERIKKLNMSVQQVMTNFTNLKSIAQTSKNGKLKLSLEDHSLGDLIQSSFDCVQEQAQRKGLNLEFDFQEPVSAFRVLVDREIFIFQVLNNFLTNALKFSEPGQKVKIKAQRINPNCIQISIRDWGFGMEEAQLKKLCSFSERTTTSGTQGEKGTGLGVPLAVKFTEAMNGDVQIVSYHFKNHDVVSRGTEVRITLPYISSLQLNRTTP